MRLFKKCPECGRRYINTFINTEKFEIFGLLFVKPCACQHMHDELKYSTYLFIGDVEVFWAIKDFHYDNPDDYEDDSGKWRWDIGTDIPRWLLEKAGLIDSDPWVEVPDPEYMDRWHDFNIGITLNIPRSEWLAERNMKWAAEYEERTGKKI